MYSLDLQFKGGGVLAYLQPWSYNRPFVPQHEAITVTDRVLRTHPLSAGENGELQRHARRHVKPEVAEMLKQMQVDAIYGNTGRPNHIAMADMTWERLREARLDDRFTDIFFKPKGVSSDESKYWGLLQLQGMGFTDITHYDDNARTVKLLAPVLPEINFVIIQDLTSGLLFSRKEMQKHPNVARIGIHRSGKIVVTYISANFGEDSSSLAISPNS